jgi:hypothetical protein
MIVANTNTYRIRRISFYIMLYSSYPDQHVIKLSAGSDIRDDFTILNTVNKIERIYCKK